MGGGRYEKDDIIDPAVGLKFFKKTSDKIEKGEGIVDAYYNDKEQKITLVGKVRIEEEGGRWITGDKAVFYIDSERLEVEGNDRSGIKLD